MSNIDIEQICISLLHKEVCPALGCTEPIAVALAAARSSEELLGGVPTSIKVEVSANIFKNGMGVGVTGTDMVGLDIAAALGAVCGRSSLGLEVLQNVNDGYVAKAKELVESGVVTVAISAQSEKLFVKVTLCVGGDVCSTTIIECHDNIVEVVKSGGVVYQQNDAFRCDDKMEYNKVDKPSELTVKDIYNFATTTDISNIEFILESATMNYALAEEGLKNNYGIKVGKSIAKSEYTYIFGDGIMQYAMSLSAAASDARMAGATLPAMSNSGSGNQGITITMPVVAVAKRIGCTTEQLIRALAMSHLIAIHIKSYLGRLSALCGCVIASSGASCGVVYLLGGDYEKATFAIKNMIGNITGMVCDGAKTGCALKVSSGVSTAIQSATLALDGVCISNQDGIINDDVEVTIKNLALVGKVGMEYTDKVILDIMLN